MAGTMPKGRNAALPDEVARALATLQGLYRGDADEVPAGWKTAKQWAEAWGMSHARTGALIARGVDQQKVDVKSFRIVVGKFIRSIPHYKVKV